ncbi:MAG TPA: DinB family protein [Terriglobales bacterium]|nr:DinB family protein [Terriglobales bacterium]
MDLLAYMLRLFSYDRWANHEVFTSLRPPAQPTARSLRWMAHIVAVEQLWLWRILDQGKVAVWPEMSLEECRRYFDVVARQWQEYLAGLSASDLERKVAYVNSKGEAYKSLVEDIMMHTIMHSAYHRGQIAADLRASGNEPAYTDFIQGIRTGCAEKG